MNRSLIFKLVVIGLVVWLSFVPAAMGAAPRPQSNPPYHTVQPGENLYRISLRYGVTVRALMQANGITNPDRIYVGQRLTIPAGELPPSPPPGPETPETQSGARVHIVQAGENLYRIGLRYGVSAQSLAWANGLTNVNMVYVGQRLVIPAAGSTPPPATPRPAPAAPPAASGKQIVVVLSEQRVYAYENSVLVRTTLASTGLPAYPTVVGTFSIYLKYPSQLMTGPDYYLPNVPYVMYFYKGYSLHGTYWHNNFGRPMSHGCVNLPTSEAAWFYDWAPLGTPVIVRY